MTDRRARPSVGGRHPGRHAPDGMAIRQGTPADVERVRALVRDAYAKYVSRMGREPAPMASDYAALIDQHLVWVAAEHEQIVGVLVLRTKDPALLLENVAVAPAYQGKGIGRALIRFAEEQALVLGLSETTLYTNEHMSENLAMYPALGYEEVDRRTDEGFTRVFFRKRIASARGPGPGP